MPNQIRDTGNEAARHTRTTRGLPDARLLNAVPHGVCILDLDLRVNFANQTLTTLIGCDDEKLIGREFFDIIDEAHRDRVSRWLRAGIESTPGNSIEGVLINRCDSSPFYADLAIGPATEPEVPNRIVSITDITARHEAEAEQRRGKRLLDAHVERTPLAVIEWKLDRSVRYWNPSAERIFGFTFDEVRSQDVFPLIVDSASTELVDRIWDRLITNTGGESSINTNITKDGRIIQCRWHNTTLTDDEGNVVGVASLAEDITDRVKAQREISEANARLERIINMLPVIVWAFDENFVPLLWNEHAERITGYRVDQIIGNPRVLELLYPDDAERMHCLSNWAELDFGDYDEIERSVTCADGSVRRILWSNIAARCPIPGWRAWGVGIDVTDRHTAFEALRESERRYRDIIQNVDLAGVITDERGRVIYANDFFLGLTGWRAEEITGIPWRNIFSPEDADAPVDLGGVLDISRFRPRAEGELVTRGGQRRTMVWTQSLLHNTRGRIVGVCALGMDVTDHRRTEAELAAHRDHLEQLVEQRTAALAESQRKLEDAERLAAMGRLAVGLSHDLGNMLLPVRCHLDTLAESDLDEEARAAFEAVRTGINFLEQLGEGLSLLSGDSTGDDPIEQITTERFSIESWWQQVSPLLQEVVPPTVEFTTRFDQGLPGVNLPRHLLTRAVMNLLVNAVEAIVHSATKGGTIEFKVTSIEAGATIRLEIRDNGPGLTEDSIRRAAEPFFTTKTRGLSTGLGLSVVDGFARMARGRFTIFSPASGGTIAQLDLPAGPPGPVTRFHGVIGVAVRIADVRVRALCTELLRAMGCMIVDGNQIEQADYAVTTREDNAAYSGRAGPEQEEQRCVWIEIDPSGGVVDIRETLLKAIGAREETP